MRKCEIIGNLTKKPEMRQTSTGKDVCSFDVAVYVSPDKSDFYSVSAWGKQGESCFKYLDKGKKVYVRGDLSTSIYTSHDRPHIQLNINASEVEFLSPKEQETATVAKGKVTQETQEDDWVPVNNSDLPF